jgi:hydrogenase-4 component F
MRQSPIWGVGFLGAALALIGTAPFAIFMSEFQILRAAAGAGAYAVLVLFLLGLGIVFVGVLRHAMAVAWGETVSRPSPERFSLADAALAFGGLAALLALGVWVPDALRSALDAAVAVVEGRP